MPGIHIDLALLLRDTVDHEFQCIIDPDPRGCHIAEHLIRSSSGEPQFLGIHVSLKSAYMRNTPHEFYVKTSSYDLIGDIAGVTDIRAVICHKEDLVLLDLNMLISVLTCTACDGIIPFIDESLELLMLILRSVRAESMLHERALDTHPADLGRNAGEQ